MRGREPRFSAPTHIMDEVSKFLGRFEEFIRNAERIQGENQADHRRIIERLEELQHFKWKLIGISTGIATIVSLGISLLHYVR